MKIGQTIKTLRKQQGITQEIFADRVGVTQTTLSQIESDIKIPRWKTLESICKQLGIPVFVLYTLATDESRDISLKQQLFHRMCMYIKSEFNRTHETNF